MDEHYVTVCLVDEYIILDSLHQDTAEKQTHPFSTSMIYVILPIKSNRQTCRQFVRI